MKSFNYAKLAIRYFLKGSNFLSIRTIGGKKQLRVGLEGSYIVFYNTNNTKYVVDEEKWNAVYIRRNSLGDEEKNINKMYNDYWESMPKCLDRYIAPYIPAIMRFLEENDLPPEIIIIEEEPPLGTGPDQIKGKEPTKDPYSTMVEGKIQNGTNNNSKN